MSKEPTRILFERFRRLYKPASEDPSDQTADNPYTNGFDFMWTGWMKACLHHLGHGDEEIARMKPAEGHAVINARLRELGLNERSMTPEEKLAAIHNQDAADNDEWEF